MRGGVDRYRPQPQRSDALVSADTERPPLDTRWICDAHRSSSERAAEFLTMQLVVTRLIQSPEIAWMRDTTCSTNVLRV